MASRLLFFCACAAVAIGACTLDACSSDGGAAGGETAGASDAAPRDVVVVFPDAEVACDPDADLLESVQDASILHGATTTGICVGCMRASCAEQLRDCAENCQCQGIMGDAIECYLTTQNLACAGRLTDYLVRHETRAAALTLLGCVRSNCPTECAVDGGVARDAQTTDAPNDG